MLKIRLQRVGRKHEPVYRVVICEHTTGPKSNKNIEVLGSYDARDKNETKVDGDRVNYWISKGAQVSDTVHNLLINLGIIKGKKVNALSKKTPIVKESEEGDASPEARPVEELPATEEAPATPEASQDEAEASEAPKEEVKEEKTSEEIEEEPKKEEEPSE